MPASDAAAARQQAAEVVAWDAAVVPRQAAEAAVLDAAAARQQAAVAAAAAGRGGGAARGRRCRAVAAGAARRRSRGGGCGGAAAGGAGRAGGGDGGGCLRFSVGADFFLGLRDDERRGLRMRCGDRKLRHRQSGRGKQHDAKVCHDVLVPENSWQRREWRVRRSIRQVDQRLIIRPHCGGCENESAFYFVDAMGWAREYSLRIQADAFKA